MTVLPVQAQHQLEVACTNPDPDFAIRFHVSLNHLQPWGSCSSGEAWNTASFSMEWDDPNPGCGGLYTVHFPDGTSWSGFDTSHGLGSATPMCHEDIQPALDWYDGTTVEKQGCTTSSACDVGGFCSNGMQEVGENCDDGNLNPGDGCSVACELEACGNGHWDPGEICDDGNVSNEDTCAMDCTHTQVVCDTSNPTSTIWPMNVGGIPFDTECTNEGFRVRRADAGPHTDEVVFGCFLDGGENGVKPESINGLVVYSNIGTNPLSPTEVVVLFFGLDTTTGGVHIEAVPTYDSNGNGQIELPQEARGELKLELEYTPTTQSGDLKAAVDGLLGQLPGGSSLQSLLAQAETVRVMSEVWGQDPAIQLLIDRVFLMVPPFSCVEILEHGGSLGDGTYRIDPDGYAGNDSFEVFCDMTIGGGGWTIVFHSSDPSLWGSTFGAPGAGQWSHDFSATSFPGNEVILIRTATGEFEKVTSIPSSELYGCTQGDDSRFWNGTLTDAFNGLHLGVHNATTKRPPGYVIVGHGCLADTQGWGFGHLAFMNDQQGWGWDSSNLGPSVFAIGVREREPVPWQGPPGLPLLGTAGSVLLAALLGIAGWKHRETKRSRGSLRRSAAPRP
jgi:cysteine-rich repeat protein